MLKNLIKKLNVRKKIALIIFTQIIALSLIISIALSVLGMRLYDSINSNNTNTKKRTIHALDLFKKQTATYARMISQNNIIQRGAYFGEVGPILKYLNPRFIEDLGVDVITIHDKDSLILAQGHLPEVFNIEDKKNKMVQTALHGEVLSEVASYNGEIILCTTFPIYHATDPAMIVGTVTVGYKINHRFANSLKEVCGADILMISKNLVNTSTFEKNIKTPIPLSEYLNQMKLADVDIINITGDIDQKGLLEIVIIIDNSSIKNTIFWIILSISALFLLTTTFVLILSLNIRKNIYNSIQTLVRGAEEISTNNYDVDIELDSRDEFQILSNAFNLMAKNIKDYTKNLQNMVNEKTKDIEATNRELNVTIKNFKLAQTQLNNRNDEIKRANKKLKKAKKSALAAAKAKSEFLANMSHEIRTPMNGVISAADLALGLEVSPKMEKYLKIIHSSAYSLLGIINDILDFSKIEAGKLDIEKTPFMLDEVFEKIGDLFAQKTMEKGIELIVDFDPNLPCALIGDSMRLQQIFTNLTGNAVKFTDKEGSVIIGAEPCESDKLKRVALKFFVKDTGIGMKPDYVENLFKPFSQADASTSRKYGGTGLGLTISKQLVELMDGKIWVESQYGIGTTFYFVIPFKRQPDFKEKRFEIPNNMSKLNILTIGNHSESQRILKKYLESFGWHVNMADSGINAIEKLKKDRDQGGSVELIFIDQMMSGMDGLELSRKITHELKIDIPIIMLIGFAKEIGQSDAEKAGIKGFLTKPVNASFLFNTIMDVLKKDSIKVERKKTNIITQASVYKKRLTGCNILVAEDNFTNQEIALAILEGSGINVRIANNGIEALKLLQNNYYDAILMDIQMPEMDGYEATRLIRQNPKFANLPIIAMTAHAMKGDEEKCLDAGMNGYVTKPINQNRLFHTLCKFLNLEERKIPEMISTVVDQKEIQEFLESDIQVEMLPTNSILPEKLPGIDIKTAMGRLAIDASTFKKIIIGFFNNSSNIDSRIRETFLQKDFKTLRMLAHSLKGSALNIGAFDLGNKAQVLELSAADAASSDLQIEDLMESLKIVLDSLQTLKTETDERHDNFDEKINKPPSFISALNDLSKAIELADIPEINTKLIIIKKYFPSKDLDQLENQIRDYDFDVALKTISDFLSDNSASL
ncbi:MAG: response regulator [Desulfobacterales bacterium]|nr:response regulator [Desulfobacterales bacterium]